MSILEPESWQANYLGKNEKLWRQYDYKTNRIVLTLEKQLINGDYVYTEMTVSVEMLEQSYHYKKPHQPYLFFYEQLKEQMDELLYHSHPKSYEHYYGIKGQSVTYYQADEIDKWAYESYGMDSNKNFVVEKSIEPVVLVSTMARKLPGMNQITTCPVKYCDEYSSGSKLFNVIQHVNDYHKWSHNKIADWLEETDLNAVFETKEKVE